MKPELPLVQPLDLNKIDEKRGRAWRQSKFWTSRQPLASAKRASKSSIGAAEAERMVDMKPHIFATKSVFRNQRIVALDVLESCRLLSQVEHIQRQSPQQKLAKNPKQGLWKEIVVSLVDKKTKNSLQINALPLRGTQVVSLEQQPNVTEYDFQLSDVPGTIERQTRPHVSKVSRAFKFELYKDTLKSKPNDKLKKKIAKGRSRMRRRQGNWKKVLSHVISMLEVSRSSTNAMLSLMNKARVKQQGFEEPELALPRNPPKFKMVLKTVMGFAKEKVKVLRRPPLADLRFYSNEVKEMSDIFKHLVKLVEPSMGPNVSVVGREKITRPGFKYWVARRGLDDPRFDPFLQRVFTYISSPTSTVTVSEYIEMLALLQKGEKNKRFAFAYLLYDLDNDGVVSSSDVFHLIEAGLHRIVPNDLRSLVAAIESSKMSDKQDSRALPKQPQNKRYNVSPARDNGEGTELGLQLEDNFESLIPEWMDALVCRREVPIYLSPSEFEENSRKENADINCLLIEILYQSFRKNSQVNVFKVDVPANAKRDITNGDRSKKRGGSILRRSIGELTALMTYEQIENTRARFAYHSQGRSKLSKNEFKALLDDFLDEQDHVVYDYFFRVFDSNQTGTVDFEQFSTTLALCALGSIEEKQRVVFSLFDFDGNNSISSEELITVMQSNIGIVMREDLEPLLDVIVDKYVGEDHKVDHTITFEEFSHAIGDPKLMKVFGNKALQALNSKPKLRK